MFQTEIIFFILLHSTINSSILPSIYKFLISCLLYKSCTLFSCDLELNYWFEWVEDIFAYILIDLYALYQRDQAGNDWRKLGSFAFLCLPSSLRQISSVSVNVFFSCETLKVSIIILINRSIDSGCSWLICFQVYG